ncbi:hypothetical protein BWH99_RS10780 [Vibrio parahaemolyticus]|nr:hypothetical protein [Vibrio parahaemolyticus]EIA9327162.1 hypothetical protein [Vibrio parahaemolyticus]EJG1681419.1 hypothetical protein [Vibrio parahaemolyticus]
MALKVYKTIDHGRRNTRYAYVCASSKVRVAELLNTTIGQLNKYGCNPLDKDDLKYAQYKYLQDGEVAYESPNESRSTNEGISERDLHRIAAIGYLDAAIHALNNCQMPSNKMKDRLLKIQGDLKELKIDAKEALEDKYSGR